MSDSEKEHVVRVLHEHGADTLRLLARLTLRADVAEDLLQELCLKLLETDLWVHAQDFRAYVFRMATNLACDWRRRQRKPGHQPLALEPFTEGHSPLDSLEQREDVQHVLDALSDLPQLQRECLVLCYLAQLPPEEIALQLGGTAHQIRGICSRGITSLRERLTPPDERLS